MLMRMAMMMMRTMMVMRRSRLILTRCGSSVRALVAIINYIVMVLHRKCYWVRKY